MRHVLFLSFIFLFLGGRAKAGSVELMVTSSDEVKSQSLSAEGQYNPPKDKTKKNQDVLFNWDASYTQSTLQSTDPGSGATIVDHSKDFTLGSGFETPGHLTVNLDLNYSTTPDENLTDVGPTLMMDYNYIFGEEKDDGSFHQALDGKIGFGYLDYDQSFSTSKAARKKNAPAKPVYGNNTIDQRSFIMGVRYKPASWVTLKETYTKYQYNRDVNQFLQYIDLPVLANVSAGMSNALSGFYFYTSKMEVYFYILDNWELDLAHSESRVATDSSLSTENDLIVTYDITDDWTVGGGFEKIMSTSPIVPTQNVVLAKLIYNF